jgi:hypothetical protein
MEFQHDLTINFTSLSADLLHSNVQGTEHGITDHNDLLFGGAGARIQRAMWRRLGGVESGLAFKTSKDNEEILRRNIELFFKTRHWIRPWLPRDANSATVTVIFSWSKVQ